MACEIEIFTQLNKSKISNTFYPANFPIVYSLNFEI